jgi:Flp pilus assembly protein TadG
MSRNQRIGLIVAAVVFALLAWKVLAPGDEDSGDQAAQTTQTTSQTSTESETDAEATEQPHETVPPEPAVTRIQIRGGEVVGGTADITVTKGDDVRIVVSSDVADEIHLHGYDVEKEVEAGQPADFKFTADVEGIFELESHRAEDAGRDPLIGTLTVEPG